MMICPQHVVDILWERQNSGGSKNGDIGNEIFLPNLPLKPATFGRIFDSLD
jgi:hypothetical protein